MGAVRVIPLGGLGEIGMNALAVEQRGEVIVIDCGVTFDNRGLGVDVVHPEFSALEAFRVRGVILTHGHEDHIGALPYFLRRFDVPVWGPPYALGLVRERAAEHELLGHSRFIETTPRTPFEVGSFTIEPIRVTHSIADATALAITTDAGVIVHTGDFKIDDSPPDGEEFDEERLREVGDAGVSLLLSDSTSIDARAPEAGSERGVGEALERVVTAAQGAVVVAMFASNVHRLKMLGAIAKATGRRIVPLGRGVVTHARVARSTGYLDWPAELVWPAERMRELPRNKILAIATGTQGEARAALGRLSRNDHPHLDLGPGDTIVLSSRVIPGNEREVFGMMGDLIRRGVELKTWISDRDIHVSGHAYPSEQRKMIELVRPRCFVPVHGTLHHLHRHAALAREAGVPNVLAIENGDVAEVDDVGIRTVGRVKTGRTHVAFARVIPDGVLRERAAIAETGVVFVSLHVDARGALVGDIGIAVRGVLDVDASDHVLADVRRQITADVAEAARLSPRDSLDDASIAEAARLATRRTIARALGFKPVAVVHVRRA